MKKEVLVILLLLVAIRTRAQIGVIKMVGKNTSEYKLGWGAYLKSALAVSKADYATVELGAYLFSLEDDSYAQGTFIFPVKLGYRYTLNRSGSGIYIEPQAGYNLFGITTLNVDGYAKDFKFNGIVLGAGTGYMLPVKSFPLDFNLHYATIMDNGGSDNYISLGLSVWINFRKRKSEEEQF